MRTEKKRVLIFGWAASPHVQRWVEGLTRRGWHIKVISSGGEALPNIETVIFPYTGLPGYLRYAKQARRAARQFQPDLVHVHYAFGFGWWGLQAKCFPLITSIWGTDLVSLARNPITRYFGSSLLQKSSAITVASRYLEQSTLSHWPNIREKLHCIPFGVPLASEPFPMPLPPVKLAYVKWHRAVYGPDILLQAMLLLKRRGIPVQLDMAGSGALTEQLHAMIQSLGLSDIVRMVGVLNKTDIADFLKQRHLMIMPSRMESFGVSALEAAAVGRPVIASNVGGIPEVVLHNQTGLLVPPEDPVALADAIEQLAKTPGEMDRMGKAGYEMVKREYNWELSLDRMSELYERVIDAAS